MDGDPPMLPLAEQNTISVARGIVDGDGQDLGKSRQNDHEPGTG